MTIARAQALLWYLDYYSGGIDGEWGEKSRTACKLFQRHHGLDDDGICGKNTEAALKKAVAEDDFCVNHSAPASEAPPWWAKIRYFTRGDTACPCKRCGGYPVEATERLMLMADEIREHFNKPMIPSSVVRCQAHNDELSGSAKNSYHTTGNAMDFCIYGVGLSEMALYLESLKNSKRIRYWYHMGNGWFHYDVYA